MFYENLYNGIISKAQNKKRKKKNGVYYERHHIIPKCLNGDNTKNNLVLLTGREHFVCHFLLMKIHPNNNSLIFAINRMSNERKMNGEYFSYIREKVSKVCSECRKGQVIIHKENIGKWIDKYEYDEYASKGWKRGNGKSESYLREKNSFYGKTHTFTFKQKMSNERKGKWCMGKENAMYGKSIHDRWVELYGKEEADKKLEAYKKNMSKISKEKGSFRGKHHSEESKKKISESRKKTHKLIDPEGNEYVRKELKEIAIEFNLHEKTLKRFMNAGKIPGPKYGSDLEERSNTMGWQIKTED